ncbi:hypothetical protein, partial [Flavobacterium psychrolimnae]
GGQFELESGGQFAPKLVVNLHWNRMVNLTGFSNLTTLTYILLSIPNRTSKPNFGSQSKTDPTHNKPISSNLP